MRPDQKVADHARRQHGVFTLAQARAAGLSDHAIQHRLEVGRWIKLSPGVMAAASSIPTWERQMNAALLSRPRSLAAGRSAAYLHRFAGYSEGHPVILTPATGNGRLSIAEVIRVSDFDRVTKTAVRGFPTTSVAETLWTIARSVPQDRLSALMDQQVSMGKTAPPDLAKVLVRLEGTRQRGLTRFREAVQAIVPESHSTAANDLEVALYRLLSSPEVPAVLRQHPLRLDRPSRVDAFIPDWLIVVEADGRNWHTRQADFQRDRDRDNELAALGILVIRFTYNDLTHHFDRCLRTLVAAGRHRRAMNTV